MKNATPTTDHSQPVAYILAHCPNCTLKLRFPVELTAPGLVPVRYAYGRTSPATADRAGFLSINSGFPTFRRAGEGPDSYLQDTEPRAAVPYLAWCVACRCPLKATRKPVRGVYASSQACDARCTHATTAACRCSCAGANHGSAA